MLTYKYSTEDVVRCVWKPKLYPCELDKHDKVSVSKRRYQNSHGSFWVTFAGELGRISDQKVCDEGSALYMVRFKCGSIIGFVERHLIEPSPLELLAIEGK